MRLATILAPLMALLLAACGNTHRVERPIGEVFANLSNLPAEADAMSLATQFPGTRYWAAEEGNKVIWHFAQGDREYGRFVAELTEAGPGATEVNTRFEADGASELAFLRDIAEAAADASLVAALEQRPVDRAAVQARIRELATSNPMGAQVATIKTVSDQIDAMAPPDPCESDDFDTRERCLQMEHLRGHSKEVFSH